MLKSVEAVARRVEALWKKRRHARAAFPGIARDVLREAALHRTLTPGAILDALARAPKLPRQFSMGTDFGNPPVTVWWGPRFFIDVYFWDEPNTSIHSHSFRGAFTVLHGVGLHAHYDFAMRRRFGDVHVGTMTLRNAELLRRGDVRAIESGDGFIHQVWHLSRPSISLAVRTRGNPDGSSIFTYMSPRMAAKSTEFLNPAARKRIQLIELLHAVGDRGLEGFVKRAVARAGDHEAFWLLAEFGSLVKDEKRLAPLVRRPWRGAFLESFRSQLVAVDLSKLTDEGARLLVALAHSIPDRAAIRRLIRDYAPRRPLADFVVEKFRLAAPGVMNETAEVVLRSLLDRRDPAEQLCRDFDVDPRRARRDAAACCVRLESIPLLRPFL